MEVFCPLPQAEHIKPNKTQKKRVLAEAGTLCYLEKSFVNLEILRSK